MIFYSKSNKTFFDDQIHDALPDDAQAITAEQHRQLLDALNYGHAIADDLTVHPRPSPAHQWQPESQSWQLDPARAAVLAAEQLAQAKTAKPLAASTAIAKLLLPKPTAALPAIPPACATAACVPKPCRCRRTNGT